MVEVNLGKEWLSRTVVIVNHLFLKVLLDYLTSRQVILTMERSPE
jgi:hypothetical protein